MKRRHGVLMLVLTVGLNLWGGMGWAGTLEPPASAVDASGNPVATGDLHSWDKKLNAANGPQTGRLAGCFSERFTCIFPDENGNYTAVRDNETGLVWERSPLTPTHTWSSARFQCTSRRVGDMNGWRLPSVHELASLPDPTNSGGNPDLPAGHPFSNVQSVSYWSASTSVEFPTFAWRVNFGDGNVFTNVKSDNRFVWCVRGGGPLSDY